MSTYIIHANNTNQTSPVLKKGKIKLQTDVTVFWAIGENPTANKTNCAFLRAGESRDINLPVKCSKIAIMAADKPGIFTVTEIQGGAPASCSS
jgi:hypothetical protein